MLNEFENWMVNISKVAELKKERTKLEADKDKVDSLADQTHGDEVLEEAFIGLSNIYDKRIKAVTYKIARLELEIAKFEYEETIRD